jgi:hypothetical protein
MRAPAWAFVQGGDPPERRPGSPYRLDSRLLGNFFQALALEIIGTKVQPCGRQRLQAFGLGQPGVFHGLLPEFLGHVHPPQAMFFGPVGLDTATTGVQRDVLVHGCVGV